MKNLSKEQQALFDALHNDRVEDYKVFSKKDYGGFFKSVIDKYPESAHFVYELLQNADDANATEVSIILQQDRLLFKHNGTKHFDVTPLDSIKVGDINSITGIGNSSKNKGEDMPSSQNKIGKFGVGFKSVFQYTETPEIYDDIYCFKIENYIIPTLIEEKNYGRKTGETLFVFRFHQNKIAQSYKEIKRRLESLQNPILFLRNLKKITWRIDDNGKQGEEFTYSKKRIEKGTFDDITFEHYLLHSPKQEDSLLMFSRDIVITSNGEKSNHPIYIGFYYNEETKQIVTSKQNQNIYCFFPTKETFGACFISHAPFLLTDNRQNIKQNETLNKNLLDLLAELAADAVVILRDYGIAHNNLLINENIFEIIPDYRRSDNNYYWDDDNEDYEENQYEQSIIKSFRKVIENEPLLLSRNNQYLYPHQAFTTHNGIYKLVNQKQFESLKDDDIDFLKWELVQRFNNYNDDYNLFEDIGRFGIEDFGQSITSEFMASQDFSWVIRFYNFLREDAAQFLNITNQSKSGSLVFRHAPIIKTEDGQWVAPFVNKTDPNVYLPIEGNNTTTSGYKFISAEYLKDNYAMKLFNQLEIKHPDEIDYIRTIILPKYTTAPSIANNVIISDFIFLLSYFQRIQNTKDEDDFITLISDKYKLVGRGNSLNPPSTLYIESTELSQYFGEKNKSLLDINFYKRNIREYKVQLVNDFLKRLGVNSMPRLVDISERYNDNLPLRIKCLFPSSKQSYYNEAYVEDRELEGFVSACENKRILKETSVYLWNEVIGIYLQPFFESGNYKATIKASTHRRSSWDIYHRDLKLIIDLKKYPWIYNNLGQPCFVEDLYLEDLAPEYNLNNCIKDVLTITKKKQDLTEKYGVTEEEQHVFDVGSKFMQASGGVVSEERILELIEKERQEIEQKNESIHQESSSLRTDKQSLSENGINDLTLHNQELYSKEELFDKKPQISPARENNKGGKQEVSLTPEMIEEIQQKEKFRAELEQIASDESKRYTYEWFNALLELEFEASGEANASGSGLRIVFSKVEKDPHSERGVLLRNPSRFIPRSIEECGNITVVFYLPNDIHPSISFEVASVQDYVLRLKCKNEDVTEVENLLKVADSVYRAELKTDTPIKLVERLQAAFRSLEYDDDYSLLDNINPNIEFIFGPPGTGKTTHLVKKWINKVAIKPRCKMLVLCPTNKAADVIAQRALENLPAASCPEDWVYRFVQTAEDLLEGSVCLRDSNAYEQDKCCIISTIARFAYDGFEGAKLKDINWDYIVIDEASMISLAEIIYPIYKCSNAKIVIAGDPFQIEPIVSEPLWKDENIYKMIQLNDFQKPKTKPVEFKITNLTTQYRAVPAIGNLYSEYAYNGAIESFREQSSQRSLKLAGFEPKSVNFVMFPVTRTSSIFEPHQVARSNIHIYSALFTFEFIRYLAANIAKQQNERPWRIGVISPYRPQAEIINKLWEQRTETYNNVDVQIGTVHGFQGDECDIILAVYNPAASGMKRNPGGVFVNKKNILNVAISRAQDYLFLIMPDGEYEDYDNLEAKSIGYIARQNSTEMTITNSQELEKIIHGDAHYLEKNTFVTVHQLANIYSEPSSKYEVRFDEKSVDIQTK